MTESDRPKPKPAGQAPAGADGEAVELTKADKDSLEEAQEELLYDTVPMPSFDEVRSAMDWAFEVEDVEESLLDKFADHATMVLEGNRQLNLSSIVDPREMAAKHYLDSWRAAQFLPIFGRTLLDLGCGAGFPSVPMALAEEETKFIAVDSRKKRIEFVTESTEALGLANIEPVWARGEEFLLTRKVHIVITRDLSSVRENVRLLRKVRQSMHFLVFLKGKSWSRELKAGEREAERLGFRFDTVWEHELPGEMGPRALLIYRAPGGAGR